MKTIIKIIVPMLFLGLLFCNSPKEKADNSVISKKNKTVVYGKVINQTLETPKVITVLACDPLDRKDQYATKLDSTGKFRAEFEMLWGHTFTINYFDDFVNVYANPGDSIYVEIDATQFYKEDKKGIRFGKKGVHFKGDNSQKNNEFRSIYNKFINIINYDLFKDKTLPLDEIMKIFNTERIRINDSIDLYCKENNISQWTQNLIQKDKLYSLANIICDYKGQSSKEALDFFTHPIFDIYKDENFCTMMFPYHLSAYYNNLTKDSVIKSKYKAEKFLDVEKLSLKKLLKLPKCLSRDYMLATLYSKILYSTVKGVRSNIDENIFYNKNVYNKVLEIQNTFQAADLSKVKSEKGAFYLTSEGKIENITNFSLEKRIKEKHKGKVIYMDIWASWCGPCRVEMVSAHELHKLFKNKNVAFINVCMKSTKEDWIKVVKDCKVSGENYFFDRDFSSETRSSLIVKGFPSYILIDKHGEIITNKAPRPSNLSKTKKAIEKLLSEE